MRKAIIILLLLLVAGCTQRPHWMFIEGNETAITISSNTSIFTVIDVSRWINVSNGIHVLDGETQTALLNRLSVTNWVNISDFFVFDGVTGLASMSAVEVSKWINVSGGLMVLDGTTGIASFSRASVTNWFNISNGKFVFDDATSLATLSSLTVVNDLIVNGSIMNYSSTSKEFLSGAVNLFTNYLAMSPVLIVNTSKGEVWVDGLNATATDLLIEDNRPGSYAVILRNTNATSEDASAEYKIINNGIEAGFLLTAPSHQFPNTTLLTTNSPTALFFENTDSQMAFNSLETDEDVLILLGNNVTITNFLEVLGNVSIQNRYGQMFIHNHSGVTIPIAAQDEWFNVTPMECGLTQSIQCSGSELTIPVDGVYAAYYSMSFIGGTNREYNYLPALNNVQIDSGDSHRQLGASADVGNTGNMPIFAASAGDIVTLQVLNQDGAQDATSFAANVVVWKIG